MSSSQHTAERYLAAFRDRRAYCRALLDLSASQPALVTGERYADLSAVLMQKQQLVDGLLDAGREPADLWNAWRIDREHLPTDVRQSCESILDDAEQLLQQILSLEAECTVRMSERQRLTEQFLHDVNRGSQALAAYESVPDAAVSRRLDLDL